MKHYNSTCRCQHPCVINSLFSARSSIPVTFYRTVDTAAAFHTHSAQSCRPSPQKTRRVGTRRACARRPADVARCYWPASDSRGRVVTSDRRRWRRRWSSARAPPGWRTARRRCTATSRREIKRASAVSLKQTTHTTYTYCSECTCTFCIQCACTFTEQSYKTATDDHEFECTF